MSQNLLDPVLLHSSLRGYRPISLWEKFQKFNNLSFWFNIIIPLIALVLIFWVLKNRYDHKRRLYDEYVPAPLNYLRGICNPPNPLA